MIYLFIIEKKIFFSPLSSFSLLLHPLSSSSPPPLLLPSQECIRHSRVLAAALESFKPSQQTDDSLVGEMIQLIDEGREERPIASEMREWDAE
jgi:hypothetical protein